MFLSKLNLATGIFVTLSLVSSVPAQQAQPVSNAPVAQPAIARSPDYVDSSGFKGKIFDVKHREPRSLLEALRPLGSGFKGATIAFSDEFRTLTVRDFPENIASIEEALKRLDTPQTAQPDVELRMNVLIASNVEGVANQFPNDLADVVKQMQATLNYKNYSNLATVVQRVRSGSRYLGMTGNAEVSAALLGTGNASSAFYEYKAHTISLVPDSTGGYVVQLTETEFTLRSNAPGIGQASIRSDLTLRNGERVVVGTATLGNKGLILVLSARVIK